MTQTDLLTLLPLIVLTAWACALLLVDLFIPKDRKGLTALLAAAGLLLAAVSMLFQPGGETSAFNSMVVRDGFSTFLNALFLLIGLLGITTAYGYIRRMNIERGEYYPLMLFSIVGMML